MKITLPPPPLPPPPPQTHTYSFLKLSRDTKQKIKMGVGSGERKIILVLLYYALLVEFALMGFTLATRRVTEFRVAVAVYFQCETPGHDPANPCDRSKFEGLLNPALSLLAYVMLLLFPVMNFTFVINFRWLKGRFCHYVLKRKDVGESSTSGGTNFSTNQTTSVHMGRLFSQASVEGGLEPQQQASSDPHASMRSGSVDLP